MIQMLKPKHQFCAFFLKIGPCPVPFSLFSSFPQSTENRFIIKLCWWPDSNRGPLVMEASALPTLPQSLPHFMVLQHWSLMCFCLIDFSRRLHLAPKRHSVYLSKRANLSSRLEAGRAISQNGEVVSLAISAPFYETGMSSRPTSH